MNKIMQFSHKIFHIGELFNSPNGKTSMPLLCAFILIITGSIGFIIGLIIHTPEVHVTALGFATLGASLLGIRRFTPDKKIENKEEIIIKDELK